MFLNYDSGKSRCCFLEELFPSKYVTSFIRKGQRAAGAGRAEQWKELADKEVPTVALWIRSQGAKICSVNLITRCQKLLCESDHKVPTVALWIWSLGAKRRILHIDDRSKEASLGCFDSGRTKWKAICWEEKDCCGIGYLMATRAHKAECRKDSLSLYYDSSCHLQTQSWSHG